MGAIDYCVHLHTKVLPSAFAFLIFGTGKTTFAMSIYLELSSFARWQHYAVPPCRHAYVLNLNIHSENHRSFCLL